MTRLTTFKNKYGRFIIELGKTHFTIKPHESMGYPDYIQEGRTHRFPYATLSKLVDGYMNDLNQFFDVYYRIFDVYYRKGDKNETK